MATDWNKAYEEDDTPWDKGYASPPLMEFLQRHSIAGRVLVPGCGTGHDVRALAEQGADVVGMDIAPSAIRKAEAINQSASERYELADVLNLKKRFHGAFDWVVEHTCLCAIDPKVRKAYAEAVQQALKPGGQYLAVFYREVGNASKDGPPYPVTKLETDALFACAFDLVETWIPQDTYPSRPIGSEEVCLWALKTTKRSG